MALEGVVPFDSELSVMTMRSFRILTVADVSDNPDSGAAGTIHHINAALRRLGHDVDEIWSDDLGRRHIQHGNLHSLLEQPRTYRRMVQRTIRRKQQYDIIEMNQPQAYLAAKYLKQSGYYGLVINRSHGVELRVDEVVPVWHQKLGIPESRFPSFTAVLRRFLHRQWPVVARFSDGFVVSCSLDRDYLYDRLKIDLKRIGCFPQGVASVFFDMPRSFVEDRWTRILHVGQFAFVKGSTLLVDIMNRVLTARPAARFTWVCAAEHHAWIESRFDSHLRDRVSLLDWMPAERLVSVFDRHGLFVFPSLYEGFGKAPFEAMARGMCVVGSREGGMRDLIVNGESGWLVPVGDVDGFTAQVIAMMDNPAGANANGMRARDCVSGLSWDVYAEKLSSFYERLRGLSG